MDLVPRAVLIGSMESLLSLLKSRWFFKSYIKMIFRLSCEHQRLLKDVMIVEAEKDWILRAKTGWEGRHGWWVRLAEWSAGPVFFALNIDTPIDGRICICERL